MVPKELQEYWVKLLGSDGMKLAIPPISAENDVNHLEAFARKKGLNGGWHYLLSDTFEHCGLIDTERENFTPVLHDSMSRAVTAIIYADAFTDDVPVLVTPSPYRWFGAEVTCTPSGHLVMVSPSTFPFCFLYAILAVTSAQATGLLQQGRMVRDKEGRVLIDPMEWACVSHRALYDATQEYLSTGTIKTPLRFVQASRFDLLPWHYVERVQRTYEQMLDFLVMHEFGHILLNHVQGAGSIRRAIPETSVAYDAVKLLTSQEEAADDFALKCLVGPDNAAELCDIAKLLEMDDVNVPELDKLWAGRTAIARYTSSLQLIKLFDLIETFHILQMPESGMRFTNLCEINGTHPSGQHRMMRAIAASKQVLDLPEWHFFNIQNVFDWSSFLTFTSHTKTDEDVQRKWRAFQNLN